MKTRLVVRNVVDQKRLLHGRLQIRAHSMLTSSLDSPVAGTAHNGASYVGGARRIADVIAPENKVCCGWVGCFRGCSSCTEQSCVHSCFATQFSPFAGTVIFVDEKMSFRSDDEEGDMGSG